MNGESHQVLRAQLGAYVLGRLDEPECVALQAHLDFCGDCRAEVAELIPVAEALAEVDPDRVTDEPAVPPGLGEAVLGRIRAERRTVKRRSARLGIGVTLAVLAGTAIGYGAADLLRATQSAIPLESVAVQQLATRVAASANLVPHTWGTEIKLTARGFEQGASYRVVVTDRRGADHPAGEFVGNGPGEIRCNLNSAVLRTEATGFRVLDTTGGTVLAADF
ncbi:MULTISPECIES: zf-HC2 domain-containing protein [unclassified Crossiella]|uniref:anti-sigma factor family protein n=1 Tax=unclassified Crossiella TaxID=2620835 RepID=UPI001FFECF81|nr:MULTISPECIES: zf-HC2 domain-containing protein [unclassified Crossiella]MCK2242755.1 zf-HC2 domain-containing protein [Crossiella sp. S99.2]MCK2256632.1 zf-HC2 domain-containing protein [Crossiella sp. S99.1]